jgi:hypothetical protein
MIMMPGMARRRSNTSRYDPRSRKLMWRVEWVFEGAGVTLVDEALPEDCVLGEVGGWVGEVTPE